MKTLEDHYQDKLEARIYKVKAQNPGMPNTAVTTIAVGKELIDARLEIEELRKEIEYLKSLRGPYR